MKPNHKQLQIKLICLIGLVVVLLAGTLFAQWLTPYDPNAQQFECALQPPSLDHWLGTDRYGRDLFSRILIGAQTSIFSTLTLVAIIAIFGTMIGILCGYFGGLFDTIVMRISDVFLAFPGLVFALAIAAILNGGVINAIIALAVINWPKYARIARSQTFTLQQLDFLQAAKLSGNSVFPIICRHVLPNISGPILVTAMLDIGTMMMEIAGLSFLGLGAQPPTAEWGSMMSGGRSMLQTYPWIVLSPGIAILITVILFNLLGDTVRDYLASNER